MSEWGGGEWEIEEGARCQAQRRESRDYSIKGELNLWLSISFCHFHNYHRQGHWFVFKRQIWRSVCSVHCLSWLHFPHHQFRSCTCWLHLDGMKFLTHFGFSSIRNNLVIRSNTTIGKAKNIWCMFHRRSRMTRKHFIPRWKFGFWDYEDFNKTCSDDCTERNRHELASDKSQGTVQTVCPRQCKSMKMRASNVAV